MYRYIVIDNEKLSIGILKNYLDNNPDYKFIGSFDKSNDAIEHLKNDEVDVVFISYSSSEENVLDFINTVNSNTLPLFIIMTSEILDIESTTTGYNIIDFMIKPFKAERLGFTLKRIEYEMELRKCTSKKLSVGHEFLFIKVDKKKVRINLDDVLYLESLRDYVKVVTTKRQFIVYSTLTNFTSDLPQDKFMRVHRSFTVSLNKVDAIDGNTLEIGDRRIIYSRKYFDEIKSRLFIGDE